MSNGENRPGSVVSQDDVESYALGDLGLLKMLDHLGFEVVLDRFDHFLFPLGFDLFLLDFGIVDPLLGLGLDPQSSQRLLPASGLEGDHH